MVAAVAAAAFSTFTAVAHADAMSAGTWDGRISGGTLSIGDGDLQKIAVPAGDPFVVTIPAARPRRSRSARRRRTSPSRRITYIDGGPGTWTGPGVSSLADRRHGRSGDRHARRHRDGPRAPAPRLQRQLPGSTSLYCQLGDTPSPQPPSPFALSLGGTATAGLATLTDSTFALQLNCGAPFITPDIGPRGGRSPVMPPGTNTLALYGQVTRRADPAPPATSRQEAADDHQEPKTTPKTVSKVQCVVPKLRGLKLTRRARRSRRPTARWAPSSARSRSGSGPPCSSRARRRHRARKGTKIKLTVAR